MKGGRFGLAAGLEREASELSWKRPAPRQSQVTSVPAQRPMQLSSGMAFCCCPAWRPGMN